MKASMWLLVAAVTAVSCRRDWRRPRGSGRPASLPVYSSYSSYDGDLPPAKEGWADRLLGPTRRQDLGDAFTALGGFGPESFLGVVMGAILTVALVGTVAYAGAVLSTSGRGLDNDAWEVDHSVWMNQLKKDFEEAWHE